jgi:hypothetical protein
MNNMARKFYISKATPEWTKAYVATWLYNRADLEPAKVDRARMRENADRLMSELRGEAPWCEQDQYVEYFSAA